MKYFKQNEQVYAYDEQQLSQGYGKDMTPMTAEEVELHINPPKTAEQIEAETRVEALAKITTLEASQLRSIRELMLDPTNTFAKAKLEDIEAQIQAERLKL